MLRNKVSYIYYCNNYNMDQAPLLSDSDFAVCEVRARDFLRSICRGGISRENCDAAMCCVCAVAEEIYLQKKNRNIKSENIDGYSVTFSDDKNGVKKLISTAELYLGNLGVLYAGVE